MFGNLHKVCRFCCYHHLQHHCYSSSSSSSSVLSWLWFLLLLLLLVILLVPFCCCPSSIVITMTDYYLCYYYSIQASPNEWTLLPISCSSRHVFLTPQTSEPRVHCRWSPQLVTQWRVRKVSGVTEITGMSLIHMHATSGFQRAWFPPGRLHWTEGWVPFSVESGLPAPPLILSVSTHSPRISLRATCSSDFNHRRVCRI